jgi:hypothetical protein
MTNARKRILRAHITPMIGLVITLAILGRVSISLIAAAAGDSFMGLGMTTMILMVSGMTTIMVVEEPFMV